jgi:murein DD-endopeptidase MepM/ murein hydrolase activator NlpD
MRLPALLVLLMLALAGGARAQPDSGPPDTALPGGIVLRLPVPGACISSPFGPRHAVGPHAALFHNGIDLPAAAGTWVGAAAAGQVVAVRHLGSSGLEVDIAHGPPGHGFISRYAHLGTVAPAIAGGLTRVVAGERIGRIGRSGITIGTHLHFELHIDGHPVDPAPYLGANFCGL